MTGERPVKPVPGGGGERCRTIVEVALNAFLSLAENAGTDGKFPLGELRRIAHAVMDADGALGVCYNAHAAKCFADFADLENELKRKDYFGRVITHPFARMLDDPTTGIERRNLHQYLATVRMIVGEEKNVEYSDLCLMVANEVMSVTPTLSRDAFYGDSRILDVLEGVQVAIAHSFRSFDPRKDWFLLMMNTDPESVSLSTNTFVPKKASDKLTHQFANAHFVLLFKALFASARPEHFDKAREKTFTAKYGKNSNVIFGHFFVELFSLEESQHPSPTPPRTMGFKTQKKPGAPKVS